MANVAVILPAAGKSSRFKDKHYKKVFIPLHDRAVWLHAAERFLNRPDVVQVMLVISPDDREYFDFKFSANAAILGVKVVDGGAERADSIQNALVHVRADADLVCIHDAARPCVYEELIDRVFAAAEKTGAAMLGLPVSGTLKRVDPARSEVLETVPRDGLWEAQTPQVFRRDWLLDAYAHRDGFQATDDAQLLERIDKPVTIVHGSPLNVKITTRDDLRFAELALKAAPKPRDHRMLHPFADDDHWR